MIYGRENELKRLNEMFKKDEFASIFLFSDRNYGKSSLIREFVTDKDSLIFTALDATSNFNLNEFSKKVYSFFNVPEQAGSFKSWKSAFEFISQYSKKYKFIIVFDNFTNILRYDSSISSILADFMENYFVSNRFLLILSGDKKDFTNKIINSKNPIWGKQNDIISLEEISFVDSIKLLGKMNYEDKLLIYGCIGSNPGYLSSVNQSLNAKENLLNLFFNKSGYLFLQTQIVLRDNIREVGMYNSILYAIANGADKVSKIVKHTNQDRTKLSKYLSYLIDLEIVKKDYPFGENPLNSRKGKYRIKEKYIEFWYKFVFPNMHEIQNDFGKSIVYSDVFEFELKKFIGHKHLNEICLNYLKGENDKNSLPIKAVGIANYWNANINVPIMYNSMQDSILISDFIVGDKNNDFRKINQLLDLEDELKNQKNIFYYIFSNRPFSEEAYELENKRKNITLLYI